MIKLVVNINFPERGDVVAVFNRGLDVEAWNRFKEQIVEDPSVGDGNKVVVAHWVQGEEARITIRDNEVTIGTKNGVNIMEMLLASFATCDAAVVAVHASFMGLKVNDITVEVSGHYNVASYVGIEGAPGSGFDGITTKIYLDAPDATPEQIAHLKHMCEVGSPVGDTFKRNVPIELEIIANE
jgi:uncharacterized OsmC-like protein